ncbi:MAG: hypothetical protein LBK83_15325 [Treponema sp.]|jgi:hypothetical protein|nr:hypothetical protein [Treponema sp.]
MAAQKFFFLPLFFLIFVSLSAQENSRWYRSNKGGMALEEASSRITALRNEYCLEVRAAVIEEISQFLRQYYNSEWKIEKRSLYENRRESRIQWLFSEEGGVVRLAAVFTREEPVAAEEEESLPPETTEAAAAEEAGETAEAAAVEETGETEGLGETEEEGEPEKTAWGFADLYDGKGLLTRELTFYTDGSEAVTDFFYRQDALIRAEAAMVEKTGEEESKKNLYTDHYRYNRSGAVRAMERLFSAEGGEETNSHLIRIPLTIPRNAADNTFVNPAPAFVSDFLEDAFEKPVFRAVFSTDGRGRVLSERREDESGAFLGLLRYRWHGERLESILLFLEEEKKEAVKEGEEAPPSKTAEQDGEPARRVDYTYDAQGNRISEKDYIKGILERQVSIDGEKETEELLMDGKVVLRAYWEKGRKIREERVKN